MLRVEESTTVSGFLLIAMGSENHSLKRTKPCPRFDHHGVNKPKKYAQKLSFPIWRLKITF